MHLITVQNITVKHQQQILLKNLSLNVSKGQHWLLVGDSGSGKTVLLNTLAGRLKPVSGNVVVHENVGSHINLVTSRHRFNDKTNTSSNLYYQQRYNSADSDQAATVQEYLQLKQLQSSHTMAWTIDKVVDLLQLKPLLNKVLIKLSNGETKRLRLAAALLLQPLVLLLDDPLSGLDSQTQEAFDSILKRIISSGITVIMSGSGHEIPSSITHVAILNNGTITNTVQAKEYKSAGEYGVQQFSAEKLQALTSGKINYSYEYVIKMKDVTVKYDQQVILNRVNWQLKPKECCALLGHNGAGKSTLLSLVNGDNPQAYANNIILFDKKRGTGESIWDIKSKVGFLSPELYQYFPTNQTGMQVIESGYYNTEGLFRLSNMAYAQKALEWMRFLQIDAYAQQSLKNMPANVQRLCLLARALIKTPPLLILDEPCQGLDKLQRLSFNNLIDQVITFTGSAVIYVTHYSNELPLCINNKLILKNGEVVAEG